MCVYIYTYIHAYTSMYIWMLSMAPLSAITQIHTTKTHTHEHTCLFEWNHVNKSKNMQTNLYTFLCEITLTNQKTCTQTCIHFWVKSRKQIKKHAHRRVYILCVCVYVCMYVCMEWSHIDIHKHAHEYTRVLLYWK